MIGQTISHYKIIEKLGEGGMGVVYKVKDLRLDRYVALKFLPTGTKDSPQDLKRFQQEGNALSALNHPSIATIYDIDEAGGQRFIALEYIPGGTVKSKVKELTESGGELPISLVVDYGIQVAEALAHAHKHGIVHRDVKTENLLLTDDQKVKITDFGLAKLSGSMEITKTGSTLGTAAYMSPEQVRGEEVDLRTDIFSLGVVIFELTTGRLPFRGEHVAALSYSIVHDETPRIRDVRAKTPAELETVVAKCLEKRKEDRYQSADQVLADLRKVREQISGYVPTEQRGASRQSRALMLMSLLVLGILGAGAMLYTYIINPPSSATQGTPTVAVLYLENMTGDPKFDSFALGMTEEIINELSNLPGVRVISRNDVRPYAGKTVDLHEIGDKLGVSYVLEGSVRIEGKRLRVMCQAIQTKDRFHFWSQGFTRELTSAIDVQSDIAQQVAIGLKAKFVQKNLESKLGLPANSLLKQ